MVSIKCVCVGHIRRLFSVCVVFVGEDVQKVSEMFLGMFCVWCEAVCVCF